MLKIADMGLGKKLEGSETSFRTGQGSYGWQAPESLLNDRMTKSVDIFSAGCLLFYVLTDSKHPFGERFEREMNIISGKYDLTPINNNPEAYDLIESMIQSDPSKRPNTHDILNHPFFWNDLRKLNFLQDASDRLESEEDNSVLVHQLEAHAPDIVANDWLKKLDQTLIDNLGKYRKYRGDSIKDLLRVIRNKKHHYRDLPQNIQEKLGSIPYGFLNYFTSKYPLLFIRTYKVLGITI